MKIKLLILKELLLSISTWNAGLFILCCCLNLKRSIVLIRLLKHLLLRSLRVWRGLRRRRLVSSKSGNLKSSVGPKLEEMKFLPDSYLNEFHKLRKEEAKIRYEKMMKAAGLEPY